MKMHDELAKAFNIQINKEMGNAYLYQSARGWLHQQALDGMAHWMHEQAEEEMTHASKLAKYVELRGNVVVYGALAAPQHEWKSALNVFEEGLGHEESTTKSILELTALARKHNDEGAVNFLKWFVDEQEEEEDVFGAIIDKFNLAAITHETSRGAALYLLDKEMDKRDHPH